MVAPILVFAIGNESRADDALGPLLLRDLGGWLKESKLSEQVELLEEFQLQVENALDMKDRQLVLFIDAGMDTPTPFAFYHAQPGDERMLYSHALTPESLLKVYVQFYERNAPDVFVLCIRGISFELGGSLTLQAAANLSAALDFVKLCLLDLDVLSWDSQCTQQALGVSIRSAQETNQITR